mmetsp:Transcript_18102/g.30862  ORF Transcript_18102/g.30862 Transcript_18102/m.30862 type:complete len:164 (-) Transcript_18102:215-706(-)
MNLSQIVEMICRKYVADGSPNLNCNFTTRRDLNSNRQLSSGGHSSCEKMEMFRGQCLSSLSFVSPVGVYVIRNTHNRPPQIPNCQFAPLASDFYDKVLNKTHSRFMTKWNSSQNTPNQVELLVVVGYHMHCTDEKSYRESREPYRQHDTGSFSEQRQRSHGFN